jgi:D-alanyl-D-alanine carboxypeptidase/D-alanyl-D-alanine-endopeptidase (penicillin-binding protein 4)
MDRKRLARMSLVLALALVGAARAGVKESIDAVVNDAYLKNVEVGVKVVRLGATADADQIVYERHGDLPLTPASNLKLVTTSAALDTLGADFVFRTLLVQKGNALALVGDGDPTLGDAELLKKVEWKSTTLFEKWAEALKARGLTKADLLLYDDSIFDDRYQHPSWPGDQIHKRYVAGVAGLNFNANCLDFYLKTRGGGEIVTYVIDPPTVDIPIRNACVQGSRNAVWLSRAAGSDEIILRGQTPASNVEPISVTINNPPRFTADAFAGAFVSAGIQIAGKPARDATVRAAIDEWTVLAVHETPIKQVLARSNKDSMNMYAEALFKRMGAAATGEPGSWENGAAAVGKYLTSLGIADNQFSLDDGSGLSRKNLVSPDLIIALLRHQYHGKNRDLYLGTLAVGGVDGTLENRFDDTPLKNRVYAKSGFIDGVSALSGYAQANSGQWYAFSILFNGIGKGTNGTAKKMQERIVLSIE